MRLEGGDVKVLYAHSKSDSLDWQTLEAHSHGTAEQAVKFAIPAYLIAGHHAGLPDWEGGSEPNGSLKARMSSDSGECDILMERQVADYVAKHEEEWKTLAKVCRPPWKFDKKDVSFWIRMLYSCLVDADFLDTEAFMNEDSASLFIPI